MEIHVWPYMMGGSRDGESIEEYTDSLGDRGWLHITRPTGGIEFYWPFSIAIGDTAKLLIYICAEEQGERNHLASLAFARMLKASGCIKL